MRQQMRQPSLRFRLSTSVAISGGGSLPSMGTFAVSSIVPWYSIPERTARHVIEKQDGALWIFAMASSSDALQQPYPKQQQLLQLSTDDGFLNCLSSRDKIARAARALAEKREERIANLEAAALESERARAEQAALYATLSTQLVGLRAQAAALAAQRKSEARVAMAEARLKGGVPRPGYTVAQRVQEAEAAKASTHRSEVSSHRAGSSRRDRRSSPRPPHSGRCGACRRRCGRTTRG